MQCLRYVVNCRFVRGFVESFVLLWLERGNWGKVPTGPEMSFQ
jgi:hypothetical protein